MNDRMNPTAMNKVLVRTLYEECINGRDLDRLESLIALDFVGARGDAETMIAAFVADPRLCPPQLAQDKEAIDSIGRALAALHADPKNLPE